MQQKLHAHLQLMPFRPVSLLIKAIPATIPHEPPALATILDQHISGQRTTTRECVSPGERCRSSAHVAAEYRRPADPYTSICELVVFFVVLALGDIPGATESTVGLNDHEENGEATNRGEKTERVEFREREDSNDGSHEEPETDTPSLRGDRVQKRGIEDC